MAIPTPDQTPDIRLKDISVADLEAATSPNGERCLCIEPTADADLHFRMLGYVDSAGNGRKVLAKDEPARVTDFEATGTPTLSSVSAGVAVVDGRGLVSSVPGLTGLNFTLGTSIDESTDPRDPNTHHLTHENGGADEISVAGLSGVLADAQPTTRTRAYTGNGTVALAATHYNTKLKENGGEWQLQDEAGARDVLKFSQTSGNGVVGAMDVDALATKAINGWTHTISPDDGEDDSPIAIVATMTDSGADPNHVAYLFRVKCTHSDSGDTESCFKLFAEYDGVGV